MILPENALVNDRTFMWTIYAKTDLHPLRRLAVRAEVAYRDAPETGYITDLANYFHGKLRATYSVPATRPVTL